MAQTTSPSLLVRVRDPLNVDAWDEFHELYAPVVRSYCRQRRIHASDVEDIVQDVMTSVAKALQGFVYDPKIGRFRSWFGTIAANRIKTFLTTEQRRHSRVQVNNDDGYQDPDGAWVAIFSERILTIACSRVRAEFSLRVWECFEATWLNNTPASTVAKSLDIPVHSVYVNKSRVLKKLELEVKRLAEDIALPPG